jgi:4-oxalomesaconate tautomerase
LPTGSVIDEVQGVAMTCIDNGMPVVLIRAEDFDLSGKETPEQLESNSALKAKIEAIRLAVGPRMNLGDVTKKTVPKMVLVSPPRQGGAISTRSFIPHRVHDAIGVLGAVSVATACMVPGSVAAKLARLSGGSTNQRVDVEHPTGFFSVDMDVNIDAGEVNVRRSALLRTARKLMSGEVFVPGAIWSGR